jgi:alkanesulfonate monooxygenase SsuD/methylene tetrahydromethanopterin reductase-like flavin-dependent oxidoreductase (luciferase family)
VRNHIAPKIREAAAAAGRPAPRIVCSLPVTVTSDVAGARQRTNEAFAIYPTLPSYAAMLAKEGATEPADVALIGSKEQVREMIADAAEAGVTELSANPVGTDAEREATFELLRDLVA